MAAAAVKLLPKLPPNELNLKEIPDEPLSCESYTACLLAADNKNLIMPEYFNLFNSLSGNSLRSLRSEWQLNTKVLV